MKKVILVIVTLFIAMNLFACAEEQSLQQVTNGINIEFAEGDSLSSVTTHVTLPLSSNKNKAVVLSWESDQPSILDAFGTVNRPEVTTEVTLTLTATIGTQSMTRTFYVTVIGLYNNVTVQFIVLDQVYQTFTIKAGQKITAFTDPVVEGYIFEGWYLAPEGTTRYEFSDTITNSWVIEARLTEIEMGSYTVEVYQENINDELYTLISSETKQAPIGTTISIPTSESGFILNNELSNPSGVISSTPLTLRLYFDRETYTITFMSDGVEVDQDVIKYGQSISLPTNLTKEDHKLEGWAYNSAGTLAFSLNDEITSNTTLYAVWTYDAVYTDYYASISGVTDSQLKSSLRTLISQMTLKTYGDSRYILDDTDRDPNNASNVILIYNRASVSGAWDGGITWNREHVWPQSFLGADAVNEIANIASDLQNLKPANPGINSSRGNNRFVDGSGVYKLVSGSGFFPGDADRGDIARILLYMHVRWNLIINTSTVGDLNMLLRWHIQDPVDNFERNRNEVIFAQQNNRNPFIDHPEFAERIWGPIIVTSTNQSTLNMESITPLEFVYVDINIHYTEFKKSSYTM
jgi:endonuclease I